jgi:sugar phosphate isomerase/epimerase
MKFGLCEGLKFLEAARDAGYDYIEPFVNELAGLSDADYADTRRRVADAGLPVAGFCRLFPWSVKIHDPEWTDDRLRDYLSRAFDRVAELGGKWAVFGNGSARRRPPEVSYAAACRRLVEVLRLAGDAGAPRGIAIVFEPLHQGETNLGNNLAEGAAFVREADHPGVALLADYFHMARAGDRMDEIARLGGVAHAHVATRGSRGFPHIDDGEEIPSFLAQLRACGCDRCSVEACGCPLVAEESPHCLAYLRRAWEALPPPEA